MKLQLSRDSFSHELFDELSFEDYLKLFDAHLPFLGSLLLTPLKEKEGLEHFTQLRKFSELFNSQELILDELLRLSSQILPLDSLLSSLEENQIEQYHLFLLHTFIVQELLLRQKEKKYAPETDNSPLEELKKIIHDFCEEGAKSIRLSDEEKALKENTYFKNKELERELQEHERDISESTGLALLYPYPRELINPSSELLATVAQCSRLRPEKKGDVVTLYHCPTEKIQGLEKELKALRQELETQVNLRLRKLCEKIIPFKEKLKGAYEKRKLRAVLYAYNKTAKDYHLSFPSFQSKGLWLTKAHLPCLQKSNFESYVPLDLEMNDHGPHVLFGANMAGKTSVLKTVYFHLSLVRLGLPVPAEDLILAFPETIELHLKNSGKIRQRLSGFADELTFFCREFKGKSYLLVDELFHSTNPMAGLELSKIFLKYFSGKDVFFFCSSFYPEILQQSGIQVYKMLDPSLEEKSASPIEEILSHTPFRIEKIKVEGLEKTFLEAQQPLKLALHFPLSEELKKNIKSAIKE